MAELDRYGYPKKGCRWRFFDSLYYFAMVVGLALPVIVVAMNAIAWIDPRRPSVLPLWLIAVLPVCYLVMRLSVSLRDE